MSFFLLLNIKEDILKNVGEQFRSPLTSIIWGKSTIEVNVDHQLFVFSHSSKYFLLCSAEEKNSKFQVWNKFTVSNDDSFYFCVKFLLL